MNWNQNKTLFLYAILIGVIAYLAPQKLNWTPSFSNQHTWPYGGKAVFERLEDLFPKEEIMVNERPLFNTTKDTSITNSSFLFINSEFTMDSLDMDQLLKLALSGNSIFIASSHFDRMLLDTLDLSMEMQAVLPGVGMLQDTSVNLDLDLSYVELDSVFDFKGELYISKFVDKDSIVCDLVGLGGIEGRVDEVFIEKPFGEGRFYLHSMPLVFTNYHLLQGNNHDYLERVFSILPNQSIYWDEYYKMGSKLEGKKSMMHVFLSERSFKWVYWLGVLSLFLFMLFHAKRRQRMIPVIDPPKNESVVFTKNIGELYFQNSNHVDILTKKINILKEYLSRKYFMHDIEFRESEIQLLMQKTVHEEDYLRTLFKQINRVLEGSRLSNSQLHKINQLINQFYTRTNINQSLKEV